MERLVYERSVVLGLSIDISSSDTYSSALNSYLTFCNTHNIPIEPTPDTLSFFTVYMCAHIKPSSVNSYLSGIVNLLEAHFPDVRKNRNGPLVSKTLAGSMRRWGTPVKRKLPLAKHHLLQVINTLKSDPTYDDILFTAMLLTGFHALLRLGEMTFPDKVAMRNYRKISLRPSVSISENKYSFFLPSHKGDAFFEGNTIIIQRLPTDTDPMRAFIAYLKKRDQKFPFNPELWLRNSGSVPTRAWFMLRLRRFFPAEIAGQSMRAGGATSLAEAGVLPSVIQAIGRWASNTFQIYIRKNPVLLQALLHGRPAHVGPQ